MGKTLKYWVKPDIENRIRAGEIRAMFQTHVTRIEPHCVWVRNAHDDQAPETAVPAVQVFAMTGYHPDFTFLKAQGIELDPETLPPPRRPRNPGNQPPGHLRSRRRRRWQKNLRHLHRKRTLPRPPDRCRHGRQGPPPGSPPSSPPRRITATNPTTSCAVAFAVAVASRSRRCCCLCSRRCVCFSPFAVVSASGSHPERSEGSLLAVVFAVASRSRRRGCLPQSLLRLLFAVAVAVASASGSHPERSEGSLLAVASRSRRRRCTCSVATQTHLSYPSLGRNQTNTYLLTGCLGCFDALL